MSNPKGWPTDNAALVIEVQSDPEGAGSILAVFGDVDMAGGPILSAAITDLEADQPVVLNLGGVSFIDSSGLRSLLSASRRARERGAVVTLIDLQPEVLRLLEITGTTDQFVIRHSHD